MTVTLELVKTEQTRLAGMIAILESQAACQTITFPATSITCEPGEKYAGVILGEDGLPAYHLILLPGDVDDHNWDDAKAWAKGVGGELPTRREQSLLFANLREEFEGTWYWSAEAYADDSRCAWCQNFYGGFQDSINQSSQLRARAVRRLVIE